MHQETTRLMIAVQQGDPTAFDHLVETLRGRAFSVARNLVGSRDDAMELCQETFLKVFRARETYNPTQPFLPWFHRILRNTCFSFLRKNRRLKKHSLTIQNADGEESDWEVVDPSPGPTEGVLREEWEETFAQAMSTLSAKDREIIALRHQKDLSYRAIAETLGIPEGTVMSRLFHARRRLRERLRPVLDEVTVGAERTPEESSDDAR